MTLALCLHCGHGKFGALLQCRQCQGPSTGDVNLDIFFSDHSLEPETIEALGRIIGRINAAYSDPALRFWIFIRYFTQQAPELMQAKVPERLGIGAQVEDALQALALPPVEIKRPPRAPGGGAYDPPERIPLSVFDKVKIGCFLVVAIAIAVLAWVNNH